MADDKKTLELQIRIAADEALRAVSSLKGEMQDLAGDFKKLSESDGAALKRTFEQAQTAAEKAAASMKLFGASSGELRQIQAQVKAAAVDLVTKGFDPQSKEVKKLTEEYKRLEKEAGDLDQATGKNVASFGDLKNALGSLAQVAALTKTLDVIRDMGTFALATADTFQTARNEFGILLGDMEAGAGLFNEIKAFNDKTPFSLDTLTQATNVLLAAKVPLQDLQKQLTKFGDLSQGNAERFTSYINAFGRAAAKGTVDMENLNTYLNRGVPILDALAQHFNVTTEEIAEMTSQGKISFTDFFAALADLTAEGGKYFGGMEKGSQSLTAMQEGLRESVASLAASFGEMLLPAAIAVVKALTDITDAINESPILKGVLAGALVALTGYLAAMAVKAGIAFAAQMSLNLAVGALNPVVMGATIAVAAAAAGYTIYASNLQKAERESEDFTLEQIKQKDAINESAAALERYKQAVKGMSFDQLQNQIRELRNEVYNYGGRDIIPSLSEQQQAMARLSAAQGEYVQRRNEFIDNLFSETQAGKIAKVNEQLALTRNILQDADLTNRQETALRETITNLNAELDRLARRTDESGNDANDMAAKWKEAWADVWKQFQAEQSGDPFALINLEEEKKNADALENHIRGLNPNSENAAVLGQVASFYAAQRSKIAQDLKDEEERLARELTESRVDDLEYELREALKNLDTLEAQRIAATVDSEEEIAAIRSRFADLRKETEENYAKQIADASVSEVERAAREWKESWNNTWEQFQDEQSANPFAALEREMERIQKEIADNPFMAEDTETIDRITAYYAAQRSKIAQGLKDEEERLARELTESRVDDLNYELQEALKNIDTLEVQRMSAAADSEEEIAAISEQYARLRAETKKKYEKQIADASVSEAERAAEEWQKSWDNTWEQFQDKQSANPFAALEREMARIQKEVADNPFMAEDIETINRITAYYAAQQTEIMDRLMAQERALTRTRVDDLEYELQERLKSIDTLEAQRISAAADSEEEIAAIRSQYADLRKETEESYAQQIADASVSEAERAAEEWQKSWDSTWEQFQDKQSANPFAALEREMARIQKEIADNPFMAEDIETINRITAYYAAQQTEIMDRLMAQERALTESRVDNLEYELQEDLKNIDAIELARITAATGSEEELTAIREQYAKLRAEIEKKYGKEIDDAAREDAERAAAALAAADPKTAEIKKRLDEARSNLVDWQQALADSLSLSLMSIEDFSAEAAIVLGDLGAQFAALGANVSLDIFEEFGRAIALAADEEYSFEKAMAEMGRQILHQLPMMFLQAGLQLVATPGMWPLGLGLIAAAGSSAIISGYTDGKIKEAEDAKKNAKGGIYDEYGRAAREYAAGGAFTNRIVSQPTHFRYGGGLGLMGEAGPEAIMPLSRGSDGRLGVNASGMAGAAVYVIIQNYTNEEVRTEESSDGSGNQIRKVIIGAVKQSITGGELDQSMSGRYGLRARGV